LDVLILSPSPTSQTATERVLFLALDDNGFRYLTQRKLKGGAVLAAHARFIKPEKLGDIVGGDCSIELVCSHESEFVSYAVHMGELFPQLASRVIFETPGLRLTQGDLQPGVLSELAIQPPTDASTSEETKSMAASAPASIAQEEGKVDPSPIKISES
jgi:hypothetical protein